MLLDLKNADYLIFDLDGTLSDNSQGIIGGVKYTLGRYGKPIPPEHELRKFIGPPLSQSFENYCGFSHDEAKNAVNVYRQYYRSGGILENVLYDDVDNMLKGLKKLGKKMYIATSKPEEFARKIISTFELEEFFDYICGSSFDGSRELKRDVIKYVIDKFGIDRDRSLMIGDRRHDVEGASELDISAMGVLYGFGSREELTCAGAKWIAETPLDVLSIISKEE